MLDRECKQCSKPIRVKPHLAAKGKGLFCSCHCHQQWRRLQARAPKEPNRECSYCQKCYYMAPKRNATRCKSGLRFCSRECLREAQKLQNGYEAMWPSHYGESLTPKYRHLVKIERCNNCGYNDIPEILEVHHIDHNRKNSAPENLEVLCSRCHDEHHFLTKTGKWGRQRQKVD